MSKKEYKTIDIVEFIKTFPYFEVFKLSFYYIIHPIQHFKLLFSKKDIYDIAIENIKKRKKK